MDICNRTFCCGGGRIDFPRDMLSHLQYLHLVAGQELCMEKICHLPIHGIECVEVAVVASCVGYLGSMLVALQRLRGFAQVVIDTPLNVMSHHPVIRRAMMVEVNHEGINGGKPGFGEYGVSTVAVADILK